MQLTWLKAYSIINVSDLFFENRIKDGKSLDPSEIHFFAADPSRALDLDYDQILIEIRYNEFKGTLDQQITNELGLKLQLTLISSIMKNELALRLD